MNWHLRTVVALSFVGMIGLAGVSIQAQDAVSQPPPLVEQGAQRGERGDRMFRSALRELLNAVSEATDLSASELSAQLTQGTTLASVITANGGSVEAVTAQATTAIEVRVQQAVTDGRLSQEWADQLLTQVPQRVQEILNRERTRPGHEGRRNAEDRLMRGVLELAATQTGLTRDQLRDAMRTQSLGQVLASHNIDASAFVESAAAELQTHLNTRISNGHLTQDQADALTLAFRQRLTERLDRVRPLSV